MAGVNKVILLGGLTRDAEVLGDNAMKFSIATSEKYTDKDGNKMENTEYHNCVAKKTGVFNYLKKGTQVYAEGKIQTTKKDDKVFVNIRVFNLTLVGNKPTQPDPLETSTPQPQDIASGSSSIDDLPF